VTAKSCTVSFSGPTGIRHSVNVTADSLFEAAAIALHTLRADGWCEAIAPGTILEVRVSQPHTTHSVTLAQLTRWCDGTAVSPDEVLKRKKVKELLAL
jgi:hypothetical protein